MNSFTPRGKDKTLDQLKLPSIHHSKGCTRGLKYDSCNDRGRIQIPQTATNVVTHKFKT